MVLACPDRPSSAVMEQTSHFSVNYLVIAHHVSEDTSLDLLLLLPIYGRSYHLYLSILFWYALIVCRFD
uniref:Uncharacterized protein n=1 Tax=Anguilla anguilla TaxID=7936 RepID=A0A0E9SCE3_ANGAN